MPTVYSDEKVHPYLQEAYAILPLLQKHRRFFHSHAEVGFQTQKCNAYITKELDMLSVPYRFCGGGIVATLGQGNSNILLRAETDALPIKEETELPFASTSAMHACGHDMHAAMLLGAAKLLSEKRESLPTRVTLLFQPAEEILSGAKQMIACGALDDAPTAAVSIHVLTDTGLPVGTLLIPPCGKVSAAADFFCASFHGKATHGAMPELGINPVFAAAHAALALSALPLQKVGADKEALLTLGALQAGETANAIPDTAVLKGSLRTHDNETRKSLREAMAHLLCNIGESFECDSALTWEAFCPALCMDERIRAQSLSVLRRVFSEDYVHELPPFTGKPRGGSEDFAFIAEQVPSLLISLAAGEHDKGYSFPLHHPKTRFDEDALPYGTAVFTALALSLGKL